MDPNKRTEHQEVSREAARAGRRECLVFKATLPGCFVLTLMKYEDHPWSPPSTAEGCWLAPWLSSQLCCRLQMP